MKMATLSTTLLLAFALLASCASSGSKEDFSFGSPIVFEAWNTRKVDDVAVWPVRNSGAGLSKAELDSFRQVLRKQLIEARFSVLADDLILERAGAEAASAGPERNREGTVARAVSVVQELEADAVLLVWLEKFDDTRLGTDGRVRSVGNLVLLGPDGQELVKGQFESDQELVKSSDNLPPGIGVRRPLAVRRLAENLAKKLPGHRN